jgi:hypothetical protein
MEDMKMVGSRSLSVDLFLYPALPGEIDPIGQKEI